MLFRRRFLLSHLSAQMHWWMWLANTQTVQLFPSLLPCCYFLYSILAVIRHVFFKRCSSLHNQTRKWQSRRIATLGRSTSRWLFWIFTRPVMQHFKNFAIFADPCCTKFQHNWIVHGWCFSKFFLPIFKGASFTRLDQIDLKVRGLNCTKLWENICQSLLRNHCFIFQISSSVSKRGQLKGKWVENLNQILELFDLAKITGGGRGRCLS